MSMLEEKLMAEVKSMTDRLMAEINRMIDKTNLNDDEAYALKAMYGTLEEDALYGKHMDCDLKRLAGVLYFLRASGKITDMEEETLHMAGNDLEAAKQRVIENDFIVRRERNREIVAMRDKGMKYKDIGAEAGVSAGQARQIVREQDYKHRMERFNEQERRILARRRYEDGRDAD